MNHHSNTPRVFVDEDTRFGKTALSQIIEDAGCTLLWSAGMRDLCGALEDAGAPIDLIVLQLHADTLGRVAEVRKRKRLAKIPMLVISELEDRELDLWQLRALGVVGLIDVDAPADHVRFRIGQIAYRGRDGRRFERAPCCIPVEIDMQGEAFDAFTTSLSVGGLGVACDRRIEPNTLLSVRFALNEGEEPVVIAGRTVHIRKARRAGAEYEVGLFFYRLSDELYTEINRTVARLLAAWDAVGGMDFSQPESPVEVLDPDRG